MLYSNDAFADIVNTRDANAGIDLPLLKMKAEESDKPLPIEQMMASTAPLHSISNLLQERPEDLSNMVFSIEKQGAQS